MHSLVSMLKYRRQQGSDSQKDFCIRFLHPIFGRPDRDGNYIKVIGNKPNVCFTSHHDTVHREDGMQRVRVEDGVAMLDYGEKSSCLGADCTTGIWLMLEMIDAGIQGVYVIHSAEEIGCVGSSRLIQRNPKWLSHIDAVISFDRRAYDSIVTHQMGYRTCSDAFANSLNDVIGLGMKPDPTGSYTDSNEYASRISECTNVSVGYFDQHSKKETQDLDFAAQLRDALITADWSKLVIKRDPSVFDVGYWEDFENSFRPREEEVVADLELEEILDIVCDHPEAVASMLYSYFGSSWDLIDELYQHGGDNLMRSASNR